MTKGVVFVNGFNLGRYWEIGPQETLYVPGPLLKQGDNEVGLQYTCRDRYQWKTSHHNCFNHSIVFAQILVFELHRPSYTLKFQAAPSLGPERIHTLLEGGADSVKLFVIKHLIKLGKWVWKPLELFMWWWHQMIVRWPLFALVPEINVEM